MAENKSNKPKEPKVIPFNKLRKGSKFMHPVTDEIFFCTFNDADCIAYGENPYLTSHYVKVTDEEEWKMNVELL